MNSSLAPESGQWEEKQFKGHCQVQIATCASLSHCLASVPGPPESPLSGPGPAESLPGTSFVLVQCQPAPLSGKQCWQRMHWVWVQHAGSLASPPSAHYLALSLDLPESLLSIQHWPGLPVSTGCRRHTQVSACCPGPPSALAHSQGACVLPSHTHQSQAHLGLCWKAQTQLSLHPAYRGTAHRSLWDSALARRQLSSHLMPRLTLVSTQHLIRLFGLLKSLCGNLYQCWTYLGLRWTL